MWSALDRRDRGDKAANERTINDRGGGREASCSATVCGVWENMRDKERTVGDIWNAVVVFFRILRPLFPISGVEIFISRPKKKKKERK